MNRALTVQEIQISNFTYDFSIPEGSNCLSDTNNSSFLLPLHVIEASFHLPLHPFFYIEASFHLSLHPFFYHLLDEYKIASGQLSGFSWWVAIMYFIEYSRHTEVSLIVVFQNLYQLKAYNRKCVVGLFYFTPCEVVKTII